MIPDQEREGKQLLSWIKFVGNKNRALQSDVYESNAQDFERDYVEHAWHTKGKCSLLTDVLQVVLSSFFGISNREKKYVDMLL